MKNNKLKIRENIKNRYMKIIKLLIIFILFIPLVQAVDLYGANFNISNSSLKTSSNVLNNTVYEVDYSLSNQPVQDQQSDDYTVYLGFHYPAEGENITSTTPAPVTPSTSQVSERSGTSKVALPSGIIDIVLILDIKDPKVKYQPRDKIDFDIILNNPNSFPFTKLTLIYYLEDLENNIYNENYEIRYNLPPGITILEREILIPEGIDSEKVSLIVRYGVEDYDLKEYGYIFEVEKKIMPTGAIVQEIKDILPKKKSILIPLLIGIAILLGSIVTALGLYLKKLFSKERRVIRKIKLMDGYRNRIINYIETLDRKLNANKMKQVDYDFYRYQFKFSGRTLDEWIDYYDEMIRDYNEKLEDVREKRVLMR